jgi:Ca2+-binding RTX toxin-like protein
MAVVFTGNPIVGTNMDDYIFDYYGGVNIFYGNDGDDVIYGDLGRADNFLSSNPNNALLSAFTNYLGNWTRNYNREIENSTTISHATVLIDGTLSGKQGWLSVDVLAGETITLDIDHGYKPSGTVDSFLEIFTGDGSLVSLASNDNSGSFDFGSATTRDPALSYTFATAGTYLINVRNMDGGAENFSADSSFVLNVSLTGQSYVSGVAADNDTIYGGNGYDTLYGMGGDDVIYGQVGYDLIYGGTGNDSIYGGSAAVDATDNTGNDTLYGDEGADTIYGNGGNDFIYGGLGADFLVGGTGVDYLYGGLGYSDTTDLSDDTMRGGDGEDYLYGNSGNDTMLGGAGIDFIFGGEGNDIIYGGAYLVDSTDLGDFIYGGNGNDEIRGNGGIDRLNGEDGNDVLIGGLGDDWLRGGDGNDYLRGGDGDDVFFFEAAPNDVTNMDTIQAFVVNVDRILLNLFTFTEIGTTLDAAEFQLGAAANDIGDRIIYNSATGQLFYDPDGNTLGGVAQTQFAVMTVATGLLPVLTFDDFIMGT